MHGALLAVVHPDNTPHGANLTFAVPILVFVIVAGALFLRFRSPHAVPGRVPLKSSRWASSGESGRASFGEDAVHAAIETRVEEAEAGTPGTVQTGTVAPAAEAQAASAPAPETPAGETSATEQVKPASEGTEDGE
ncbi:MAG TPA: hypothetical protein VF843_13710 [Streptosporangiaceae bacterium]